MDHHTAWIRMCAPWIRVASKQGRLAPRQANLKARRTRGRVGLHVAAVCRHDLLHDEQSQTESIRTSLEVDPTSERLEQHGQYVRADLAAVLHLQAYFAA